MRLLVIGAMVATSLFGARLQAKDVVPAGSPTIQPEKMVKATEVAGLVAQLRSPNYRTREAAGKALLAAGDRVLDTLKTVLKAERDAEAVRRLEVIIDTIEKNRLISARLITLQVKNKTAKAIVDELEKQSGYSIQYNNNNDDQRFSYNWKEVPFWKALDEICNDAGLQANANGNDGTLQLYNNGHSLNPYVSYSGPFKILASNISMSRSLTLANIPRVGAGNSNEYNNLNLTVHSEPKAPIVGIGQAKLTKAFDEKGNSMLIPVNNNNQYSSNYYGGSSHYRQFYQSFSVNLIRPNRNAETIREIHGVVPVTMLSETRPEISIEDFLKVKDKKYVGRTIELHIKSTDYQNDVVTIELTASRRNANQEDYNWAYAIQQRFQVMDAQGNPFQFNGVQNQQHGNNTTNMTMQFRQPYNGKKLGKPTRFEFQEWFTITRDVPFSFRNIPLP